METWKRWVSAQRRKGRRLTVVAANGELGGVGPCIAGMFEKAASAALFEELLQLGVEI